MSQLQDHLEKIKIFAAVAQLGGVSRAAKALHLSQPAVSKSVSILEDRLQASLFIRGKRGMQTTAAGLRLLQFAQSVLSEAASVEAQIREDEFSQKVIRFNLASYPPVVFYLFPALLNAVSGDLPGVQIKIYEDISTSNILNRLLANDIDAAFILNANEQKQLRSFPAFAVRHDLFVARSLLKTASKKNLDASKLAHSSDLPLIVFREALAGVSLKLGDIVDQASIHPGRLIEANSFNGVLAATLGGLGIGILPRNYGLQFKDLTVVPMAKLGRIKITQQQFHLVVRSDLPTALSQKLLKAAKTASALT